MGFLQGKRALIAGVSSRRSTAWGVAEAFRREGAELACPCQSEKLRERVAPMALELGAPLTATCDLASDEQIEALFAWLRRSGWDRIDIIVHSAALAPTASLPLPRPPVPCSRQRPVSSP